KPKAGAVLVVVIARQQTYNKHITIIGSSRLVKKGAGHPCSNLVAGKNRCTIARPRQAIHCQQRLSSAIPKTVFCQYFFGLSAFLCCMRNKYAGNSSSWL